MCIFNRTDARNGAVLAEGQITPCKQNLLGNRVIVYLIPRYGLPHPSAALKIQTTSRGRSAGKASLLFRRSRKVWRRCDGRSNDGAFRPGNEPSVLVLLQRVVHRLLSLRGLVFVSRLSIPPSRSANSSLVS